MVDCKKEGGGPNWQEIKVRRKLGINRRLEPEDELTPVICQACVNWMLWNGREIGTGFLEAAVSRSEGGISEPRYYAQDLLRAIAANSPA